MELSPCISAKKELFYSAALAVLLACTVRSAAEASPDKNSQCHNYAGGHVYPGEAFRVPVSDHSLHLSKAKSEFFFLFLEGRLPPTLVFEARWRARNLAFRLVLFLLVRVLSGQ